MKKPFQLRIERVLGYYDYAYNVSKNNVNNNEDCAMTINLMQISTAVKTMSSREIAELCEKRHDHVCRDIELLNETLAQEALPKIGESLYRANNGQAYKEFLLTKEQTIDLLTGYNRNLRVRINRRWQELEAQASQPVVQLPNFSNPVEAARAWADEVEQKQFAIEQVNELAPKAAALEQIANTEGELGIREAAKALGMQQSDFVEWCTDEKKPEHLRKPPHKLFLYRDGGKVLNAYSHRVQQGYMTQKLNLFTDKNGREKTSPKVRFTPAGITKIAEILQKEKQAEEVAPCTI